MSSTAPPLDPAPPSTEVPRGGLPPLRFSLPLLLLAFGLGLILFQFLYLTKVDEEAILAQSREHFERRERGEI